MNCQDLNISLCHYCLHNLSDINLCWTSFYEQIIKEKTKKEVREHFISSLHNKDWTYYHSQVIYKLFPQYADMINKLLILK